MKFIFQQWRQSMLLLAVVASIVALGYSESVIITEGQEFKAKINENAYMECKVSNLTSGQTVSWKFIDHSVTISAGNKVTVTGPLKYEIDKPQIDHGGQTYWNLRIFDLKSTDGGSYQCMVDSTNVAITHTLVILDAPPVPPYKPLNETDCCIANGVGDCALPLCDQNRPPEEVLKIVLTGADCIDQYLFDILKCGSDRRNHIGCCMRKGVSEFCQPLCNYEVTDPSHLDRDYTQCIPQTATISECFSVGQGALPSQPESVSAVSLPTGFLLTWTAPEENLDLVIGYKVQYKLKSDTQYTTTELQLSLMKRISNLQENVVYEARVIAVTQYGASAPSYTVDVATVPASVAASRNESVLACCEKQQLSSQCKPFCKADTLQTGVRPGSVLACFGELNRIFTCLVGGDITPCCKRVLIPEDCLPLCSGKVLSVQTSEVPCMLYLPLVSACAVEGLSMLPSPPLNTHLVPGSVTYNSAIVQWDAPDDNSADYYRVAWKPDQEKGSTYTTTTVVTGYRHELTGLRESTLYRLLVVSVNQNGSSLPEQELLFITEGRSTITPEPFNDTACCIERGMPDSCLPLCNHTFILSDEALSLGFMCSNYLMQLLVCGTDGRDHTSCCKERGITEECLPLCKLKHTDILYPTPDLVGCVLQKDALSKCFDEGKMVLPKMPEEVSIQKQDINSLVVNWKAPSGPNITSYIVEYRDQDNDRLTWMNETTPHTFVTLGNLKADTVYYIRVYSVADNYTSLPSERLEQRTLPIPTPNVTVDWTQVWQNRSHCCENSGLDDACIDVCKTGNLQNQQCANSIGKMLACGADGRNHATCCQQYPDFPDACLPYCMGQDAAVAWCIPFIKAIVTCFTDGQGVLPTPPQNFRVTGYTHENITVAWDAPSSNCDSGCGYYVAVWEIGKQNQMDQERTIITNHTYSGLKPQTQYRLVAVAMNSKGSSLPSTSILVVTKPLPLSVIIVSQSPNHVIDLNGNVEFRCTASSSPVGVIKVQWIRNNNVKSENNVLTLTKVSITDEGNYTCRVKYEDYRTKDKILWLNVKYKPSAIRMDEDQVMPGLNMDAYLTCQYKGFPDEITWTKTGAATRIFSNNKYLVSLNRNEDTGVTYGKLQVKNVTEADYGSYTCVGQNKFGKNENGLTGQLMNVYPTVPPPATLPPNTTMNNCCVTEGLPSDCSENLCTFSVDLATASAYPKCLQYLDKLIFCGADHRDHSQCCREAGIADVCFPMCQGIAPDMSAIDDFAICLGHIETIMQCAEDGHKFIPTQPLSVSASIQYDQMLITWTPPKKNADKIHSYEIYYQSNTSNTVKPFIAQVSQSLNVTAINGVKSGVTYTIWMVAKNSYGQSHNSDTTTLFVSGLTPRKPVNLEAYIVENISIRVHWDPPLNSNVKVTSYWVYFKPDNVKDYQHVVSGLSDTVRLDNLLANMKYDIYVVAYSAYGQGESSDMIYINTKTVPFYFSTAAPRKGTSEKTVGLAVGLTLALVLLVAVAALSIFFYRRMGSKTFTSSSDTGTVAFENPHYGEPNTGVKISGLPGSSADNQFGYSTLHEETDTESRHTYSEYDNDTNRADNDNRPRDNGDHKFAYDNPLAKDGEEPATLKVDQ